MSPNGNEKKKNNNDYRNNKNSSGPVIKIYNGSRYIQVNHKYPGTP